MSVSSPQLPRSKTASALTRRLLIAGVAAAIATPSLAWSWGGERVTGSNKIVSESRAVSGFTSVSLGSSIKVVLRQSGREGVELRGDDNLLPLLETKVVDGHTLEVRWKDGVRVSHDSKIVATVDVRELHDVAVAGSGDISGEGLKTDKLNVRISGSGDVSLGTLAASELAVSLSGSGDFKAGGHSGKLAISISGSGDVDTDTLDSDDVTVRIAGSGDAAVTARKSLAVSIAGSGDVVYRGDAQPQTSIAGSGSVKRR